MAHDLDVEPQEVSIIPLSSWFFLVLAGWLLASLSGAL